MSRQFDTDHALDCMQHAVSIAPQCPVCDSTAGTLLGTLSAMDWYRCQDCGSVHAEFDTAERKGEDNV